MKVGNGRDHAKDVFDCTRPGSGREGLLSRELRLRFILASSPKEMLSLGSLTW